MKAVKLSSFLSLSLMILVSFGCQKNSDNTVFNPPTVEPPVDTDFQPVNSLFMGNSFFKPVGKLFNEIAAENVPGHFGEDVGAANRGGVPSALWEDVEKRESILEIIDKNKVDLFGMLAINRSHYGYNPMDTATWDIQYYRYWIDAALEKNPETTFFLGSYWHWLDIGPGTPDYEAYSYEDYLELSRYNIAEPGRQLTEVLRLLYPDNKFYFVWYGEVTCELKKMQQAGKLGRVTNWAGPKENSIHEADIGHMGTIMEKINPLIFMHVIYGPEYIPETEYLGVDCDEVAKKIGANIIAANPY